MVKSGKNGPKHLSEKNDAILSLLDFFGFFMSLSFSCDGFQFVHPFWERNSRSNVTEGFPFVLLIIRIQFYATGLYGGKYNAQCDVQSLTQLHSSSFNTRVQSCTGEKTKDISMRLGMKFITVRAAC